METCALIVAAGESISIRPPLISGESSKFRNTNPARKKMFALAIGMSLVLWFGFLKAVVLLKYSAV